MRQKRPPIILSTNFFFSYPLQSISQSFLFTHLFALFSRRFPERDSVCAVAMSEMETTNTPAEAKPKPERL